MKVLERIKLEYGDFHDALVVNFKYDSGFDYSTKEITIDKIKIRISCFNLNKKFSESNELIELICTDINYLNFSKPNSMIFQAFIEKNENEYILDFDPIITSDRETGKDLISKENENSSFIVKCNKIEFNILEQ